MALSRTRVFQDQPRKELQNVFDSLFANGSLKRALDAGCGYELALDFPADVHLVGIDISADALAKNENADEKILGDIQTYPLPAGSFDAVLCWWVLEHVRRPEDAFRNMSRSLRPGGVLVLSVPRLWSIKGIVTRLTPYRFHIWVYRKLLGVSDAGTAGVGPYPTYLQRDLAPRRLVAIGAEEQMDLVYTRSYGGIPDQLPVPLRVSLGLVARLGRFMTARRWDPLLSEYVALFRKR